LSRAVAVVAPLALAACAVWMAERPDESSLAVLVGAAVLVAAGVAWFETGPDSAKELAGIATLAGVAAAGRVLFAGIPGVQPLTVIAVAAGVALGVRAGFAVGAVAAFVSNLFLPEGPWTLWQMLLWGGCGAVGALAAPLLRRRVVFALVCCALGLAFSALMDVWQWWAFYPHTWQAFAALHATGLPFDVAHGVGNFLIALAVGPELRRLLERFARRLHTEVVWA
jgi:energy-coupling factor transport system substrate-specific component